MYKPGLSFYRKFTGKSVKLFYRFAGKKNSVNFGKSNFLREIIADFSIFDKSKKINGLGYDMKSQETSLITTTLLTNKS